MSLALHPDLAPYKVAVLPLLKKRPEIVELCHRIKADLKRHTMAVYDDTAAIGKLYRRQDEIGTPWCVTVDVDSLEDGAVTVRDRDSMTQERVPVEGVDPPDPRPAGRRAGRVTAARDRRVVRAGPPPPACAPRRSRGSTRSTPSGAPRRPTRSPATSGSCGTTGRVRAAGSPSAAMTARQRDLAWAVVDAAMSERGAAEIRSIVALEPVLGDLERRTGILRWERRDPELYWLAVFGDPAGGDPWSWRLGGHHVAVQATVMASFLRMFNGHPGEMNMGGIKTLWDVDGIVYMILVACSSASPRSCRHPVVRGAGLLAVGTALSPVATLLPEEHKALVAVPVGLALLGLGYSLWSERREEAAEALAGKGSLQLDQSGAD